MSKFIAFPYQHELLQQQIAEHAHNDTNVSTIQNKAQDDYLSGYLAAMDARTFVVETQYVDRDYLEEHAAYYVRCFRDYKRFCSRIHFFSALLTQEQVDSAANGTCNSDFCELLADRYLGFVVIKPLPQKFIGRTCLKTYPPNSEDYVRYYPALVDYKAHLAGLTLPVRSLAFQEQDHGVAACATSALWSAFQITGRTFQHAIPSPAAITQAAVSGGKTARVFPSDGLTIQEICQACRAMGLDAEVFSFPAQPAAEFKSVVHAYLAGGLPVVLVVQLLNLPGAGEQDGPALHAVTLSGYSMGPELDGCWRASRMNKVYAHDDQIGPFARMGITSATVRAVGDSEPTLRTVLTTSWIDESGGRGGVENVIAVPLYAVVPVYHKIRVSARQLLKDVAWLDFLCGKLSESVPLPIPVPSNWGVELTTITELKARWRQDELLLPQEKARLLPKFLPRFTWVITARDVDDIPLFDILVDATDTSDGACVADVVVRDAATLDQTTGMAHVLTEIPNVPINHLIACLAERAAET